MIKFMIASHGHLAQGMQSALSIIIGERAKQICTVNAFVEGEEENAKQQLEEALSRFSPQDQVIVFTDIMYGSVNQYLMPFVSDRVIVITGMNLPLLCEVIACCELWQEDHVDMAKLREIIAMARGELQLVNDVLAEKEKISTEQFFE